MNLRYVYNIIVLGHFGCRTIETGGSPIDRVSRKYTILINVDKTKVMASDGIACRILIQNEQLEQVDTFPYIGQMVSVRRNSAPG